MGKPNSTNRDCDCKPGTFENGWQEVRGESCLEAERQSFIKALEAIKGLDSRKRS